MTWSTPVHTDTNTVRYNFGFSVPGSDFILQAGGNANFTDVEFAALLDALAALPFVSGIYNNKDAIDQSMDRSTYTP